MDQLTQEEKDIVIQVLNEVSLPVKQAPTILAIVEKLKTKPFMQTLAESTTSS